MKTYAGTGQLGERKGQRRGSSNVRQAAVRSVTSGVSCVPCRVPAFDRDGGRVLIAPHAPEETALPVP